MHHVVIDAHDLSALARFWAQVLGWRILSEHEQEIVIGAESWTILADPEGNEFCVVRPKRTLID